MMNMKQYNGKHGCSACEIEGICRQGSHLHRDWPYNQQEVVRSNQQSLLENAREAISTDSVVC